MVGHISYLSEKGQEKFGRKLQEKADYEFSFNVDFQVESYLRHQLCLLKGLMLTLFFI